LSNQINPNSDRRLGWKPLIYSVETYGGEKQDIELPFVVAVIADLTGKGPTENIQLTKFHYRKFREVDTDNINAVLESCNPGVRFKVTNFLSEDNDQDDLNIVLSFKCLDDFRPERVAQQIEPLAKLIELRAKLESLSVRLDVRSEISDDIKIWFQNTKSLPNLQKFVVSNYDSDSIKLKLEEINVPLSLKTYNSVHLILSLADACNSEDENLPLAVKRKIKEFDALLSKQLDKILHHEEFQRLEATWQGLAYLARQTESGTLLKIRVLDAKKKGGRQGISKVSRDT
jgi:type VI secretion system ImpB/VipA family protein